MKHLFYLFFIAIFLTGCHSSKKIELTKVSFDVDLYEFVNSSLAMLLDSIVKNMPDSDMRNCNAYLIRYTDIPDTVFYHSNWPLFGEMPDTLLDCDEPFLSNLSIQSYHYEYHGLNFKPEKTVGACKLNDKLCYIIEPQTAQRLFKKTNQTDSVSWETDGSTCPCMEQDYWFNIDKRDQCRMLNYQWGEIHYSNKQAQ